MRAVIAVVGLLALGSPAAWAGSKKDKAAQKAVAELEAAWQPVGAATGAARTDAACANAVKLQTAADAVPKDAAIKTSAVDNETWRIAVDGVLVSLESLPRACKAPDRKLKHIGGKVETADDIVAALAGDVAAVVDEAKPRDVPKALKTFRTTYDGTRPSDKQLCKKRDQLAKLAAGLAAPANADATKWQAAQAKLTSALDELKSFACGKPRGADDEISGSLQAVHDAYYQLVLLVPPRAP